MLATIFYYLLNMTINASFFIVVILIIRNIKPIPRRLFYLLWILPFVRLVFPFAVSSKFSFFNYTGALIKRIIYIKTIPEAPLDLSMTNMIGAANNYFPITYKSEDLKFIFQLSSVIWVIAAFALLLTTFILYHLSKSELNKAVRIKDNLFKSEMVFSPVTVGILKPRIILPGFLKPDCEDTAMIIRHENIHLRRMDNLWRVAAIVIVCFHWFNPFAWLLLKYFFQDMELSCDEKAIRNLKPAERKHYAEALLRFAGDKGFVVSTAFGKSNVKVRIVNVLNFKKLTTMGIVTSILFLLVISLLFITNPSF